MTQIIFGSENAENDQLLYDCYVSQPQEVTSKSILTGRWGTGKTALLLHAGRPLSTELAKINEPEKLWYLDEYTLDLNSLLKLQTDFDKQNLTRALEGLWKAEIVRVLCLLLSRLWVYYGSPRGDHWSFVGKVAKSEDAIRPIWKRVPDAIALILGPDKDRYKAVTDIQNTFEAFFLERALNVIQDCLREITNYPIQPIVAVEPIDTPTSALEEQTSLAQTIITALLNLYRSTFEPSQNQLVQLRLSVPWHRYVPDDLDFPQKLPQYIGTIKWREASLREFINARIEWEFKTLDRGFTRKGSVDAWSTLFEDRVRNTYCEPETFEDSFKYFLRHTHHRPRDLQRMARLAVESQASFSGASVHDVLLGRGGKKIGDSVIKETIRRNCRNSTKERITEARRKYSDLSQIIDNFYGLPVPFAIEDVKKRITGSNVAEVLTKLWSAGIIGVELTPKSEQARQFLAVTFGDGACRYYSLGGGEKVYKWYFFEYNWDGEITELMNRYRESEETEALFVLHPITFAKLMPNVNRVCPIGA